MNKPQDPVAAEPVQTTSVPAVDLPRLVRLGCCPWCGSKLQVDYEPMSKLCEDDPDRQWYLDCRYCGAEGPRCRTQLEALKMLAEPEQTAERDRLFPEPNIGLCGGAGA
jgi:hypothetical protein